jgi:hypothetical protein
MQAGPERPAGSWNQDDVIVFSRVNSGLFRVSAKGGSPVPLTALDRSRNEGAQWLPWFLPDGRHFLYLLVVSGGVEKGGLYIGDLASKTPKHLGIGNTRAIYVNPGYLLFVRDRMLMAQPFNASALETTGDPAPVAEQVTAPTMVTGGPLGHFSASQNGVLAYTTGVTAGAVQLTWFDGHGTKLDTSGVVGFVQWFSLSPDGRSVAFARSDETAGQFDVWTRDLVRGSDTRLTFTGDNLYPIWSADGNNVFFMSNRNGQYTVGRKAPNRSESEHVVETAREWPMDASRDGKNLLTIAPNNRPSARPGGDIRVLNLSGDGKSVPYVTTAFNANRPKLSPDRRWLAYQSSESNDRSECTSSAFRSRIAGSRSRPRAAGCRCGAAMVTSCFMTISTTRS